MGEKGGGSVGSESMGHPKNWEETSFWSDLAQLQVALETIIDNTVGDFSLLILTFLVAFLLSDVSLIVFPQLPSTNHFRGVMVPN